MNIHFIIDEIEFIFYPFRNTNENSIYTGGEGGVGGGYTNGPPPPPPPFFGHFLIGLLCRILSKLHSVQNPPQIQNGGGILKSGGEVGGGVGGVLV